MAEFSKFEISEETAGTIMNLSTRTVYERIRQIEKWGEQHHEFRIEASRDDYADEEAYFKRQFERQSHLGPGPTWDIILLEEVYEALAEDDPKKRVEELVQVAAVALAIAEDIESRG